jgi:hypothetical protein
MSKHFRFSGSNFAKLEELGVCVSQVLRTGVFQATSRARDHGGVFCSVEGHRKSAQILRSASWLGTETKTERFHPIGLAALSSENFGAAIDQMARYKQLTCPEEILQEKDARVEHPVPLAFGMRATVTVRSSWPSRWRVGQYLMRKPGRSRGASGCARSEWSINSNAGK